MFVHQFILKLLIPLSTMRVCSLTDAIKVMSKKKFAIQDTTSTLDFFLNIFGLNSSKNSTSSCKPRSSLMKAYTAAMLLGIIHFYLLQYKIRYLYSDIRISIKLTDTVQAIYDYVQYIVDLYFVNKYGGQLSSEYLGQYEIIDRILDMDARYPLIKRRVRRLLAMFIVIWLISTACDFIAWYLNAGFFTTIMYSFAYFFFLIKLLTTLDLCTQVMQIESRLLIISDLIRDCYKSTETHSCNILNKDIMCSENWFYSDACSRDMTAAAPHRIKKICDKSHKEVKLLTRCYLMLTEQCMFVNKMYGIRILLNSLSLLIDMIRFTNIAVRIVIGSQHTPYDLGYYPAVTSVLRMMACAAVLVSLVHHCELAYRQVDRISSIIDHLLLNRNPGEELRHAAKEFQALTQSRPITFDMAHFFRLNCSFLLSTASVFVTYTIILLQSLN